MTGAEGTSNSGRVMNNSLVRFFFVSILGTVADFASALLLHSVFGLSGVSASTIGFVIGGTINYLAHHHVTFRKGKEGPPTLTGLFKYYLAIVASLVVRLVVLVVLERLTAWPFWLMLSIAFVASFLCSYLVSLFWVFRAKA